MKSNATLGSRCLASWCKSSILIASLSLIGRGLAKGTEGAVTWPISGAAANSLDATTGYRLAWQAVAGLLLPDENGTKKPRHQPGLVFLAVGSSASVTVRSPAAVGTAMPRAPGVAPRTIRSVRPAIALVPAMVAPMIASAAADIDVTAMGAADQ